MSIFTTAHRIALGMRMRSKRWYLRLRKTCANIPEVNNQTKDKTPELFMRTTETTSTSMRTHRQKSKRRFSAIHPTGAPRTVFLDCLRDAVSDGVENSRRDDFGRDGVGLFVNVRFLCTSIRFVYQSMIFPIREHYCDRRVYLHLKSIVFAIDITGTQFHSLLEHEVD